MSTTTAGPGRIGWALADSWTMTRRELAHWARQPVQVVVGLDAFETGKRLLPLSVAMLAFALLGTRMAARRSPRTVAQMGLVAVSIGAIVMLAAAARSARLVSSRAPSERTSSTRRSRTLTKPTDAARRC